MKLREDYTPAALYARVSSDRQDVDLSIAAQMRALRDYADKKGYMVVREYIDEAESGRIADRPQFRRMLDDASKPSSPFQEILVWKFSRFTRKREHAVAFKSMLRRKGIRVVSITEHADDSPTGKLMEAIIESVDEFYSENLAQEVSRGMREAASRGFFLGPKAPFGYRKVYVQDGAKQRPKLEPNPPADAVVKCIFDMALQGKSSLDITKALNAEGVASPKKKAVAQEHHPQDAQQRGLHRDRRLGTQRQGRRAAGPGGEGVSLPSSRSVSSDRSQDCLQLPRAQERTPQARVQPLPAQWAGQVRDVRQGTHRRRSQERQVHLLRLPLTAQKGQGDVRDSQAQLQEVRESDRRHHPREHPHREQHPRPGEDRGRGDGQRCARAAQEIEGHRG